MANDWEHDPQRNWYYCPESDRQPKGFNYTLHQPVSYDQWREWGVVPIKKWVGAELELDRYETVIAYDCRYCGQLILGDFICSGHVYAGSPGGLVMWCRALVIEEEWWL